MTVYVAIRSQDAGIAALCRSLEAAQALAHGEWVGPIEGRQYDCAPLLMWLRNGPVDDTAIDMIQAHELA